MLQPLTILVALHQTYFSLLKHFYWGNQKMTQYVDAVQKVVSRVGCFPQSTGHAPIHTAQDTLDLPCCQGSLLDPVEPAAHQEPKVLFSRAVLQPVSLQTASLLGLFPTRCRTFQLLLNFIKFLSAHSSSLLGLLWIAALLLSVSADPTNVLSSGYLTEVHSHLLNW